MGSIHSQDYYHINRLVPWSPHGPLNAGDEVDVGGGSNPFFRVFETQRAVGNVPQGDGSAAVQYPGIQFLSLVASGEIDAPNNLAAQARDVAGHFMRYVRELIWEDVRRREFPHLPSRQRCVWLIPTQEGVRYWLREMQINRDFQVLRVRVQGRLHEASESYLLRESEPMEETVKKARLYWLGVVEDADTKEIIFEGRMRVEEVMPASFYA